MTYIRTEQGGQTTYLEVLDVATAGSTFSVTLLDVAAQEAAVGVPEFALSVPPGAVTTANVFDEVLVWLLSETGPYPDGVETTRAAYDLHVAQKEKLARIKELRASHELNGLPTSFGVADSDRDSQRKISGGVQMAMISLTNQIEVSPGNGLGDAMFPDGFSLYWRFRDNSVVPLTALQMVQMGVEVGKQVAQVQMVKNYLDSQVLAASTVEEVQAIDVEVNWFTVNPLA